MANMQATKTPMPEQDPNVRNKNFKEVTLGYTAEMAINEAKRCLQCKKPHCVEGCPVNIHIPEFIHEVAEGNFEKAYEIITDTNSLPALSGRVCPQETQCESKCVRGNLRRSDLFSGIYRRCVLPAGIDPDDLYHVHCIFRYSRRRSVCGERAGTGLSGDFRLDVYCGSRKLFGGPFDR